MGATVITKLARALPQLSLPVTSVRNIMPAILEQKTASVTFEGDLAVSMALPETVEIHTINPKKAASSSTHAVVEIIK